MKLKKGEQIYKKLKEVIKDFWDWKCERNYCSECCFNICIPSSIDTEEEVKNLCDILIEIREGIKDIEEKVF